MINFLSFHSFFLLSFLILLNFSFISSHNWVLDKSRAGFSSTLYPWPVKITNAPHIQVAANQIFTLDWSAGHGNDLTLFNFKTFTYFVIFHFDDQKFVPADADAMKLIIADYLASAPRSANLTDPQWRKNHILPPTKLSFDGILFDNLDFRLRFSTTAPRYWGSEAGSDHPRYIPRDPEALKQCKATSINDQLCGSYTPSQWVYSDYDLADDYRVEYFNPKYPWIEAIHKFQILPTEVFYAYSAQTARFRVPARKGPGNYMIWFVWDGYYDVVDGKKKETNSSKKERKKRMKKDFYLFIK